MKLCCIDLDCHQHRTRATVVMSQPRFKPENVVIVPERVSKKRKVEDIGPRIHFLTVGLLWTEMRLYTWQVLQSNTSCMFNVHLVYVLYCHIIYLHILTTFCDSREPSGVFHTLSHCWCDMRGAAKPWL